MYDYEWSRCNPYGRRRSNVTTSWVLVLITLTFHGHPIATEEGRYETMKDCFYAREKLAFDVGADLGTGHFPKGTQAVCVPIDSEE